MRAKIKQEAQNPLILRCHRLMEAFAKSDDERDFYIDRLEGFLIYVDLDKPELELKALDEELAQNSDRYCPIPKLSFYETKKIMEGFVNEKVYDIDTKEKLLDIIQSKEARENFLEFIYDHHAEQEKWQQFYQERSRIRIIEWLRQSHFHFVFEEDLDLPRHLIEKLKHSLFQPKANKEILNARKTLVAKAKTYYSTEALNPRPKRGRPPKQAVKADIEPQVTLDVYTAVTLATRPFLFVPDMNTSPTSSAFSSKFDTAEELPNTPRPQSLETEASLSQKLASLRTLSDRWIGRPSPAFQPKPMEELMGEQKEGEDLEQDLTRKPQRKFPQNSTRTKVKGKNPSTSSLGQPSSTKSSPKSAKLKTKRIMPRVRPPRNAS